MDRISFESEKYLVRRKYSKVTTPPPSLVSCSFSKISIEIYYATIINLIKPNKARVS